MHKKEMSIKYNEIEKTIEIKDGLKNQYFFMKFMAILNLLNAVLRLLNLNTTGIRSQEILWIILGVGSLIILYIFMYKRTAKDKIPVSEIRGLKNSFGFGGKRFSIKLLNGKKRELPLKNQTEFNELKKTFNEIGIVN